jgi:two-component system cell cycle response regulator DivK
VRGSRRGGGGRRHPQGLSGTGAVSYKGLLRGSEDRPEPRSAARSGVFPSQGQGPGPEGARMSKILIVEDNEKNMKLVRDILAFRGHQVLEATTGEQGVAIATSELPDLVLMDIQLPDIDGIEALRRIRAVAALDAVPVLAVSASVMPEDQHKIASSGFDAYVTKPISLKPFVATVEKHLSQGRSA